MCHKKKAPSGRCILFAVPEPPHLGTSIHCDKRLVSLPDNQKFVKFCREKGTGCSTACLHCDKSSKRVNTFLERHDERGGWRLEGGVNDNKRLVGRREPVCQCTQPSCRDQSQLSIRRMVPIGLNPIEKLDQKPDLFCECLGMTPPVHGCLDVVREPSRLRAFGSPKSNYRPVTVSDAVILLV